MFPNKTRQWLWLVMYLVSSGITGIPLCEGATHKLSWSKPTTYNNNTLIPSSLTGTIETRIYYSYDNRAWSLFATVGNGGESWAGELPPGEGVQAYYAATATIPGEGGESSMSEPVVFPAQGASPGGMVTVTLEDCTDTYINSGAPLNPYSKDSLIRTYTWPAQNVANRGFMRWNLSSLPANVTVTNAKLSLYSVLEEGGGGDSTYTVSVARVLGVNPVFEMCNWDTFDGIAPWTGGEDGGAADLDVPESCAGIGKTHGWVTWDVTKMVQGWIATPATNYGMAIDGDLFASAGSNRYFASREYPDPSLRPQLVVAYNNRITPPPVTPPPPIGEYTITSSVTAAGGGTIAPAGSTTVSAGGSQTYVITSNPGYKVNSVAVNGAWVGAVTSFTLSNVRTNYTITADFVPVTYTIAVIQSPNGYITPYTFTGFTAGESQTYGVSPNAGYRVASLTVDGVPQALATSYRFTNIQANHMITATFERIPNP